MADQIIRQAETILREEIAQGMAVSTLDGRATGSRRRRSSEWP